ncbi:DUF2057 family protein [Litoribrevibacter albus]|uniref:DUF2057 domain-containing protein n=1 Tax=Litoribrevibacter albus TaxID=1473156 RepID=A0AA37WAG5_9GAMM|nr:DUF2057 family protein [Litoribrevibacter albus]GLQ33701.1 hypothetical protein GCM10007876_41810 [Litoribrevibacter albus]
MMIRLFLVMMIGVVLSGCLATGGPIHYYKGEPRDESKLATIILPEEIDVVAVNNRKRALPLVRGETYELKLLPGLNELVLEYDTLWELDADTHETVTSDVVMISQVLKAGDVYSISVPKFDSLSAAKQYAKNFKVDMVKKATGETVASKPARYGVMSSVPMSRVMSNLEAGVTGESEVVVHGSEDRAHQAAGLYSPLQNLRYWWKEASEQERELFEDWMATVE